MITHSIIAAAGMGTRLGDLTTTNPKGLVRVSDEALVPRLLAQLGNAGVSHTKVVVGYLGDKLIDEVSKGAWAVGVEFLRNPHYRSSNNVTSLFLALSPERPVVIADCDVFLSEFPTRWLEPDGSDLAVPTRTLREGETGTVLRMESSGRLQLHVARTPNEIRCGDRKTISVYLIKSHDLARDLCSEAGAAISRGRTDLYYEDVLARAVGARYQIAQYKVEDWGITAFEIDTPQDLRDAETWFAANAACGPSAIEEAHHAR
ncbi:NTP transferase domain-containing protein [Pelagibacterium sp. H642]|uniref:phosphocholine cytidylyltransferase family protein n=1 Tax=Pelagibacterium sp. H642 TaxID=1881069 RepID=UPI0028156EF4|nr:NTP transferase domain-containing protein [Pelagibacterium sp. H642]WMT92545.1 NTP transferase domain-containing protein [Pelagibacterium sp. H642]